MKKLKKLPAIKEALQRAGKGAWLSVGFRRRVYSPVADVFLHVNHKTEILGEATIKWDRAGAMREFRFLSNAFSPVDHSSP